MMFFIDAEQVILEYGIPGKKKNMVHSGGELFWIDTIAE